MSTSTLSGSLARPARRMVDLRRVGLRPGGKHSGLRCTGPGDAPGGPRCGAAKRPSGPRSGGTQLSPSAGGADVQLGDRLGLKPGMVVQELGWDEDVDDEIRE